MVESFFPPAAFQLPDDGPAVGGDVLQLVVEFPLAGPDGLEVQSRERRNEGFSAPADCLGEQCGDPPALVLVEPSEDQLHVLPPLLVSGEVPGVGQHRRKHPVSRSPRFHGGKNEICTTSRSSGKQIFPCALASGAGNTFPVQHR